MYRGSMLPGYGGAVDRTAQKGTVTMGESRKPYSEMSTEELEALEKSLKAEYKKMQGLGLELNMSRGKPCVGQLDLSWA